MAGASETGNFTRKKCPHSLPRLTEGHSYEDMPSNLQYSPVEQITEPYCDSCHDTSGKVVIAHGFCEDCSCFFCKPCVSNHKRRFDSRKHRILGSTALSKSQAGKYVNYSWCSFHSDRENNHFCLTHNKMICSKCVHERHDACETAPIDKLCKSLGLADLQRFKVTVGTMLESVVSAKVILENNLSDVEAQKRTMIKDAETQRDKLLAVIQDLYTDATTEIKNICRQKTNHIASQISLLSDTVHSLNKSLMHIDRNKDTKVVPNQFIQMQDIAERTRRFGQYISKIKKQLCTTHLSFCGILEAHDLRSWCMKLGTVNEVLATIDCLDAIPEPRFPVQSTRNNIILKQNDVKIRTLKLNPRCIQLPEDNHNCEIAGLGITADGTLLVADAGNKKLKAISRRNQILSSLSLPFTPGAITIAETKVAVSTYSSNIYFADINDPSAMALDKMVLKSSGGSITNLASYDDRFVVTINGDMPSVNLMDSHGKEIWCISVNPINLFLGLKLNRELFQFPCSVATRTVNGKPEIIVADSGKRNLTVLDGKTGGLIRVLTETEKRPNCVTTDTEGNIYVSYVNERRIDMWMTDLQSCEMVVSEADLQYEPEYVVYDKQFHELLVCSSDSCMIDRFHCS